MKANPLVFLELFLFLARKTLTTLPAVLKSSWRSSSVASSERLATLTVQSSLWEDCILDPLSKALLDVVLRKGGWYLLGFAVFRPPMVPIPGLVLLGAMIPVPTVVLMSPAAPLLIREEPKPKFSPLVEELGPSPNPEDTAEPRSFMELFCWP